MFGWFKKKPTINQTEVLTTFLDLTEKLLSVQVMTEFSPLKTIFSTLMTNKRAAGYVLGFHDGMLQMYRAKFDKATLGDMIGESYKHIFGQSAGYALCETSIANQQDPEFAAGLMVGGSEAASFLRDKVQPLGLSRILLLGMKG